MIQITNSRPSFHACFQIADLEVLKKAYNHFVKTGDRNINFSAERALSMMPIRKASAALPEDY